LTFAFSYPPVSVEKWSIKADTGKLFQLVITANVAPRKVKHSLHNWDIKTQRLGIGLWSLCPRSVPGRYVATDANNSFLRDVHMFRWMYLFRKSRKHSGSDRYRQGLPQ
jgi:hypothetical protein